MLLWRDSATTEWAVRTNLWIVCGAVLLVASVGTCGWAQSSTPCPRFPAGGTATQPDNLVGQSGVLSVAFTYQTRTDQNGNILYCYTTQSGSQSPTLRVHPGDNLKITLQNLVPAPASSPATGAMSGMTMAIPASSACGAATMTAASTNIHYHGTNTPPVCHQDEVIHTMVNSGQTFAYDLQSPADEPPGLYWYHPHVHGISEAAVAMIVGRGSVSGPRCPRLHSSPSIRRLSKL